MMLSLGNSRINEIILGECQLDRILITEGSSREERDSFIREKYTTCIKNGFLMMDVEKVLLLFKVKI